MHAAEVLQAWSFRLIHKPSISTAYCTEVKEALYLALVTVSLIQVLLGRGQLSPSELQVSSHSLYLISGALLVRRLCMHTQQIIQHDITRLVLLR